MDFSDNFEVSSGYGNFYRYESGKFGIYFDNSGEGVERIWSKEADTTLNVCLLHYIHLSCSTTVAVGLFDGSDGEGIVGIKTGDDAGDTSAPMHASQTWDFRDDPLVCLTADTTKSISVCAGDGWVSGFIKVSWGTRPK